MAELKDVGFGSLSYPCPLGLSAYLNLIMLGLEACQTYIYSGSACIEPKNVKSGNLVNPHLFGLEHSWTRGCWIWQLAIPICIWAQHIAEANDIESDRAQCLAEPKNVGPESKSNLCHLSLTSCQVHVYRVITLPLILLKINLD
jgi:hypothetical protein